MQNIEMKLLVKGYFKQSNDCEEFDTIRLKSSEHRFEIEKVQLTKLETEHRNGTYPSMHTYFIYKLFRINIYSCVDYRVRSANQTVPRVCMRSIYRGIQSSVCCIICLPGESREAEQRHNLGIERYSPRMGPNMLDPAGQPNSF